MFVFRRPTEERVRQYLLSLKDAPLSYGAVGCTRESQKEEPIPRGFNQDHERVVLGKGEETYRRACQAVRTWQMMPPSVVQPCPAGVPIEEGGMVANIFRAWTLGGWLVLPTRILYLVDEATDDFTRSGFAYGTVQGHWEHGEERFLVEWDRRDDSVWYDLLVFSRPRHPLAKLAYPYTRYEQARFRRLSCAAMRGIEKERRRE
jgi:uncharacterized protein (UPF0548 family)